jgi:hypothetical protein
LAIAKLSYSDDDDTISTLSLSDRYTETDVEPLQSDSEGEEIIDEGDYLLARYHMKRSVKYYVGKVIQVNEDKSYIMLQLYI